MRTVGEVAAAAGVTVRTLHHYDQLGLVTPSAHSDAGYRLYSDTDVERLQTVLFYRALGFPLDAIGAAMAGDRYERVSALHEQRALLAADLERRQEMIAAIDAALAAHEEGRIMSDEELFEVFGDAQRELQAEAEERWGDTDAWARSRDRTARYTKRDWEDVKVESQMIMDRIAAVFRSGAEPASDAAMDAVEAHRAQISARFYECSHAMQANLGDMYVADPRFTATYEAIERGLTMWVRDAIRANAVRAGVG